MVYQRFKAKHQAWFSVTIHQDYYATGDDSYLPEELRCQLLDESLLRSNQLDEDLEAARLCQKEQDELDHRDRQAAEDRRLAETLAEEYSREYAASLAEQQNHTCPWMPQSVPSVTATRNLFIATSSKESG